MEKGEKKNGQRTVHKCKMAGSGRTKMASRVTSKRKSNKNVAKILTSNRNRRKGRNKGEVAGIGAKE